MASCVGELQAIGCHIVFQVADALGARDRHGVVELGEQPRQRNLAGHGLRLLGHCIHLLDDSDVRLLVVAVESRISPPEVAVVQLVKRPDRARRIIADAASERPSPPILPSAINCDNAPTVSSTGIPGSILC